MITLKHLTIAYILFLMATVIILDFELIPEPRELVKTYAADTTLAKHYPQRFLPYEDKIAHFFLVGALTLLVNLSLSLSRISIGRFSILKGSLILLILVTLEEVSQMWFPERSCSWSDLFSNYAGIICFGQLAIALMHNRAFFEPKLPRVVAALIWKPTEPAYTNRM